MYIHDPLGHIISFLIILRKKNIYFSHYVKHIFSVKNIWFTLKEKDVESPCESWPSAPQSYYIVKAWRGMHKVNNFSLITITIYRKPKLPSQFKEDSSFDCLLHFHALC